MFVIIPSFLHSSLHPSICELHYAVPFSSLCPSSSCTCYSLALLFMHSIAFFLSASYRNLPFPPSPFNVPICESHYTLNALSLHLCISLHHYTCTFPWAFLLVHLTVASIKHVHVVTPLWNVCAAFYPVMFASHYIQCSQIWQQTNKNRQIRCFLLLDTKYVS